MQPGFEPRKCYRCGEVKPAIDFAWRRRHQLERDSFCRSCRSAYGKEHYQANMQRYIQAQVVKRRLARERTAWLIEYFKTHRASTAGNSIPWCSSSTT